MNKKLIALALLLMPLLAWGQDCPFWQVIAFADGNKGCLADYPFARAPVAGLQRPLEKAVTARGQYAVSASLGRACPLVAGAALPSIAVPRGRAAAQACEAALAQASAPAGCTCSQVVFDGTSRLTKAQFDGRFLPSGSQVAKVVPAAPAPQMRASAPPAVAAAPAPAPAAAAAPASAPAAQPRKPSRAEEEQARTREALERLQERLAQLEAARAASAPARPPASAPARRPASATAAATPAPPRRETPRLTARALVIGNSSYSSFGALANPGRDARAIAAKLESFGIPVHLVLDAQRDDIIEALNQHSRQASGKDVSIFFYAGHGVQVEGVNYLIPVNMRGHDLSAGYIKLAGISLNAALDYLPARTRLVFLDACRDNPASRSLVSTRSAAAAGLAPVNAASGTLVAYATRDGATANDGDGMHSPYTAALLKHIDSPMDISLVLRQVRQTVLQLTSGRQEPWEYGSLVGDQIVLPQLRR